MRIYRNNNKSFLPRAFTLQLSRRRFIRNTAIFIAMSVVPLSACKRLFYKDEKKPGRFSLSEKEKKILLAVQKHLFPDDEEGPGARLINALHHFEFVVSDKHLDPWERKILFYGIKWTNETAYEFYQKGFILLNHDEKERVLRDLETYRNGKRWLSFVLGYLFEALLGPTAYSVNPNQIGWKWLKHAPGFPQPETNQIYGTYGYGL